MVLFALSVVATVVLFRIMPQGVPPERGHRASSPATPKARNGISFDEHGAASAGGRRAFCASDPDIAGRHFVGGFGRRRAAAASRAPVRIRLKPARASALRRRADHRADLRPQIRADPGHPRRFCRIRRRIRIGGRISKAPYQYTLQRRGHRRALPPRATRLSDALRRTPGFLDVTSDLDLYRRRRSTSTINRDRAAALGVSSQQIETALGTAFGGAADLAHLHADRPVSRSSSKCCRRYQQRCRRASRLYLTRLVQRRARAA